MNCKRLIVEKATLMTSSNGAVEMHKASDWLCNQASVVRLKEASKITKRVTRANAIVKKSSIEVAR